MQVGSDRGRCPVVVLLLAAVLASPAPLRARADNGWIGKRVITQYGTVLQVGNQVVDDQGRGKQLARGKDRKVFRIYKVEQVNGPWLWLVAEGSGVKGWAPAADIIPFDQAIDHITNRIRANPGSAAKYLWRAAVWSAREKPDKTIADYNEAIPLDPGNASPYIGRGNAWSDKEEYDKAIADYNEAIRLDSGYSLAYHGCGNAWSDKEEYDQAIADYSVAIRLDPEYATAYYNRGLAWRGKKQYDKAIADSNEAIRLNPGYAMAYFSRGVASLLLGSEKAAGDQRKFLELEGWRAEYSQYAVILGHVGARRAGKADAARRFLDDAAAQCDTLAWPYPVIRFLRGEIDAKALLAAAGDNDKMIDARCYLGLGLTLKGQAAAAREHFLWVKEHGNRAFTEYAVALAELDRLEKDAGRSGADRAGSGPGRR